METDCLEIVNLWNTRHGSRWAVAPILQEIGELVSSFSSFLIQHVVRPANYRTHLCAKLACTLVMTSSWLDCTLDFLVVSFSGFHFSLSTFFVSFLFF
jgi:hypothetical protein